MILSARSKSRSTVIKSISSLSKPNYWQDRLINYLMDYDNDNISIKGNKHNIYYLHCHFIVIFSYLFGKEIDQHQKGLTVGLNWNFYLYKTWQSETKIFIDADFLVIYFGVLKEGMATLCTLEKRRLMTIWSHFHKTMQIENPCKVSLNGINCCFPVLFFLEISEKMSLHPNDIISTLQFLGMLKYWKGRHMVLLRKVGTIMSCFVSF